MTPLQIVLIVLIFLIVLGTGMAFLRGQEEARKKRLMGVVQGNAALRQASSAVNEKDLQNKRRAEIAKKLKSDKAGADDIAGQKSKPGLDEKNRPGGAFLSRLANSGFSPFSPWCSLC